MQSADPEVEESQSLLRSDIEGNATRAVIGVPIYRLCSGALSGCISQFWNVREDVER